MNKLVIFLLCSILLVQFGMYFTITYEDRESAKMIKSVDGYFDEKKVTGINVPGCGFFVDTRNRKFEKINKTINHEICHEFIERKEDHFCE